jgi:hypothetical protein
MSNYISLNVFCSQIHLHTHKKQQRNVDPRHYTSVSYIIICNCPETLQQVVGEHIMHTEHANTYVCAAKT